MKLSDYEAFGHKPFGAKRRVYSGSKLAITRCIARGTDWTPQVSDERQKDLVHVAVRAWSPRPRIAPRTGAGRTARRGVQAVSSLASR